jgi:hypothetical protein
MSFSGGCMCGAVRYRTEGEPVRVIACHCRSWSPGVGRAFCANCGTPLTWETSFADLGPVCALHISTFDDPDALVPTAHSFYPERISWFDVADSLPRYESFVKDGTLVCHGPANADPSG